MLVSHTLLLPWFIASGYDIEVFRSGVQQGRLLHSHIPIVVSNSKPP